MPWNGTCGLSQLPIKLNEDIVCFVLQVSQLADPRTQGGHGGYNSSHDLWTPLTIGIYGTYDEFGGITNVIDKYDTVFNQLYEHIKLNENFNKRNKTPHIKLNSLENIIDHIERGHVDDLSLIYFHKDLYINVIRDMNVRILNPEDPLRREKLESEVDSFNNREDKEVITLTSKGKEHIIPGDINQKGMKNNKLYSHFKEIGTYYLLEDRPFKHKEDLVDFMLFNKAMSISRKLWIPQAGAGTNSEEYAIAGIIGDFANSLIKKKHDYYKSKDPHEYIYNRNTIGREGFYEID